MVVVPGRDQGRNAFIQKVTDLIGTAMERILKKTGQ
jgi:hypothetical protein